MEATPPASTTGDLVPSPAGESTAQLNLTQPPMFRSLSDVFGNVVPRGLTGFGDNEWPNLLERADSGFEKDKALQAVVSILQYLEKSSPMTLVAATEVLADGSRYGKPITNFQAATGTSTRTSS